MGRVFAFDFALFTLAMALSVWFTGFILDNTTISPRQFTFILAVGTLWPIIPWMWLNRNDPLRATAVAPETFD